MGQFPKTSHVSIRECAICLPFIPEDLPLPLLLDFHLGKVHDIGKELSFIGFAFFFQWETLPGNQRVEGICGQVNGLLAGTLLLSIYSSVKIIQHAT